MILGPDRPPDLRHFGAFRATYLGTRPPRRHANIAFNPRQAGKRQAMVELIAVELLEGLTPYLDARPRHLAPDVKTLSIASPKLEDSEATLADARVLAIAWLGPRWPVWPIGRHEAPVAR